MAVQTEKLERISCAEFPRQIGERCTFRDWLFLDASYDLGNGRLLFARIPAAERSAMAVPFVVVCVSTAKVGWTVDSIEYFDCLAVAHAAAFRPWRAS